MARSVTNSINNAKSRYTQGGSTEEFRNRLGWWERDVFMLERSDDDLLITISPKYDRRPDTLAYDLYGNAISGWVILQYNHIVDVNEEFRAGKQIRVPEPTRAAFDMFNKPTGGVTPSEQR